MSDGDPAVAFGPRPVPTGSPGATAPGSTTPTWPRTSPRAQLQGLRSHRGLAHRQRAGGGSRRQERVDAAGGDLPAVVHHVLRQGADLGRQRRLAVRSSATCTSAGRRSAARRRATPRRRRCRWRSHTTAATPGRSTRSRPPPTTASATPPDGCTIRTDSRGQRVRLRRRNRASAGKQAFELMSVSAQRRRDLVDASAPVAGPVTQPGVLDPVQGRPVIDGMAGARSDLAPGAQRRHRQRRADRVGRDRPDGDELRQRNASTRPHVYFTESSDRGATWTTPRPIETAGDRGLYTAPAISPNGTACTSCTTRSPRRTDQHDRSTRPGGSGPAGHGDLRRDGNVVTLHRGAPGDPRGSSANALIAEFLGDYVYAAATDTSAPPCGTTPATPTTALP